MADSTDLAGASKRQAEAAELGAGPHLPTVLSAGEEESIAGARGPS
jgi:hypothetical protein